MRLTGIVDNSVDKYDRPFFGFLGIFTGDAGPASGKSVWEIIKRYCYYYKKKKESNDA